MKTNTSHLQAAPTNDLLNLPDIDGVFNEVKTSTSPSSSQPMLRHSPDSQQLAALPAVCPTVRLPCQEVRPQKL